jgi:hypothetical protein
VPSRARKFSQHQVIVMVGETGSGKTTQYGRREHDFSVNIMLTDAQNTPVRMLLGSAAYTGKDGGVYSA